jgi:hypothetical protein
MIRRLARAAGTAFQLIDPSETFRSALRLCPCTDLTSAI